MTGGGAVAAHRRGETGLRLVAGFSKMSLSSRFMNVYGFITLSASMARGTESTSRCK